MQTCQTADVDAKIAYGKLRIARIPPAITADLVAYYIQFNQEGGTTTFCSIAEVSDDVLSAFLTPWMHLNGIALSTPEERLSVIQDLYARGCVHGAYVHLWFISF